MMGEEREERERERGEEREWGVDRWGPMPHGIPRISAKPPLQNRSMVKYARY